MSCRKSHTNPYNSTLYCVPCVVHKESLGCLWFGKVETNHDTNPTDMPNVPCHSASLSDYDLYALPTKASHSRQWIHPSLFSQKRKLTSSLNHTAQWKTQPQSHYHKPTQSRSACYHIQSCLSFYINYITKTLKNHFVFPTMQQRLSNHTSCCFPTNRQT